MGSVGGAGVVRTTGAATLEVLAWTVLDMVEFLASGTPPDSHPGGYEPQGPRSRLLLPTGPTPDARVSLAGMSDDFDGPRPTPWAPWVRIVALLLVVGLVGVYVLSFF
jgi:hypothetical protein